MVVVKLEDAHVRPLFLLLLLVCYGEYQLTKKNLDLILRLIITLDSTLTLSDCVSYLVTQLEIIQMTPYHSSIIGEGILLCDVAWTVSRLTAFVFKDKAGSLRLYKLGDLSYYIRVSAT